jgi:hypothetical protein
MTRLVTSRNTPRPDEIFEALASLHEGLSETACRQAEARLLLLLANHIGDEAVIREAVTLAKKGLDTPA